MQKSKSKENRSLRKIFLNPNFQTRWVGYFLIASCLLSFVTMVLLFRTLNENYQILVQLSPMTDASKAQLDNEFTALCYQVLGLNILFIFIFGYLGIVFTHRIVGPIYKTIKVLNEVSNGNRSARVQLRPKDEFTDLADKVNQVLDIFTVK